MGLSFHAYFFPEKKDVRELTRKKLMIDAELHGNLGSVCKNLTLNFLHKTFIGSL